VLRRGRLVAFDGAGRLIFRFPPGFSVGITRCALDKLFEQLRRIDIGLTEDI
jgi:hypothetical protein